MEQEKMLVTKIFSVFFPTMFFYPINPLPNNKILDMTKLKAFADDKLKVAKMTISLFDGVENAVGKGENAGYQHFLLFPQCFLKPSYLGSLKVGIVWYTLYHASLTVNDPEKEPAFSPFPTISILFQKQISILNCIFFVFYKVFQIGLV